MDLKHELIVGAVLLLIGFSIGKFFTPARVETKIVTVVQKVEVTQHDTTTTETTHTDGTKTTVTVDKSVDSTRTDSTTKSDTVVDGKPRWNIAVDFAPQNPEIGYFYGVNVKRRMLGPVFAGAFINTDRRVGVSLGLEF